MITHEQALEQLRAIFPELDDDAFLRALDRNHWQLEATIDALLSGNVPEPQPRPEPRPHSPRPSVHQTRRQAGADVLIDPVLGDVIEAPSQRRGSVVVLPDDFLRVPGFRTARSEEAARETMRLQMARQQFNEVAGDNTRRTFSAGYGLMDVNFRMPPGYTAWRMPNGQIVAYPPGTAPPGVSLRRREDGTFGEHLRTGREVHVDDYRKQKKKEERERRRKESGGLVGMLFGKGREEGQEGQEGQEGLEGLEGQEMVSMASSEYPQLRQQESFEEEDRGLLSGRHKYG